MSPKKTQTGRAPAVASSSLPARFADTPISVGRFFGVTSAVDAVARRCVLALRARLGFMAIVGPAGTGKTSLARYLAAGLADAGHHVGLLPCSASFSNHEFLALAAVALGVPARPTRVDTLRALRERLGARTDLHARNILILDDAHHVSDAATLGDLAYIRPTPPRRTVFDPDYDVSADMQRAQGPIASISAPAPGMIFAFGDDALHDRVMRAIPPYHQDEYPVRIPPTTAGDTMDLLQGMLVARAADPALASAELADELNQALASELDGATGRAQGGLPVGNVVRLVDAIVPHLMRNRTPPGKKARQLLIELGRADAAATNSRAAGGADEVSADIGATRTAGGPPQDADHSKPAERAGAKAPVAPTKARGAAPTGAVAKKPRAKKASAAKARSASA